jgi:hypothetical protein
MAGPVTMLARFVATVPFNVGTHVLGVVATPASGEQLDVKHAFEARGVSTQAPAALHVPPHAPFAQALPAAARGVVHAPLVGLHVPTAWQGSVGAHDTGVPATHVPLRQLSPWVHALSSLQAVPSGASGFEHVPLDGSHEPATWQALDAVQVTAVPEAHEPAWHASPTVHAFPSEHAVPFGAEGFEQAPVLGLHVPGRLHCPDAAQTTGFDPTQVPPSQASLCVQALPSLHVVPFAATGFEHAPLDGLHVPAVWHWSDAAHVMGFDPTQVPAWHASVCVQALPSLQVVPFAATGLEHVPLDGLHVPGVWHWSDAAQVIGFDPTQVPAWHASVWVHALPSLQVVPFAATGLEHAPLDGLHVPAV